MAIISAGVRDHAGDRDGAIAENAARMERVRAALKRAGIADKDIQTSSISLNPDYRYADNQPPRADGLSGDEQCQRSNFATSATTGTILDALVAEGANQINGPSLTIDKPEGGAMTKRGPRRSPTGRARADLYARALGMRVVRLLSVSESGGYIRGRRCRWLLRARCRRWSPPRPRSIPARRSCRSTLSMSFELQ